jgi:HD-like signal output (HDOD) protein
MDKHGILERIAAEAAEGEIVFPTGTEIAMRVRKELGDPNCSLDKLAKLVQSEPFLAARVVAMANSVAYGRVGKTVTDVRTAVMRLGFRTLQALATAVVVRQMENLAKSPAHRALAADLWQHTAHVASLAHVIARRVTRQDAETAFFAGIVHEVGGFYLISRGADFPGLLDGDLADWDGELEAKVGRAVLRELAVPENVMLAIEASWEGYLAMPPETLGDTLLLADELAPVESPLRTLSGDGRQGAAASIDLTLDDQTLSGILAESAEEIASLLAALHS